MLILKLARLIVLTVMSLISLASPPAASAPMPIDYSLTLCSYGQSLEYTLESKDGGYLLGSPHGEELFSDLYSALNSLPDGAAVRLISLESAGGIIERSLALSGELAVTSGNLAVAGCDVSLNGLSLTLNVGSVVIKSGSLRLDGGYIRSHLSEAVTLISLSSELHIAGGEVRADGNTAILNTLGSVIISGGSVSSGVGNCIYNNSSLILSGGRLSSGLPEISTSLPISVSYDGEYYFESIRVEYREGVRKGRITPVFYNATATQAELFSLVDSEGEIYPLSFTARLDSVLEECLLSVNLPYEIGFYHGDELLLREYKYEGEKLSAPDIIPPLGYSLLGWYSDYALKDKFSFGEAVGRDLTLFCDYRLLSPAFEISSLSFTYDKLSHTLAFDRIYHPCLGEGRLYYKWYKNGEVISSSEALSFCDVSDSGVYKCELTFTYNGDFSYSVTPELKVEILPISVSVSPLGSKVYTGDILFPDIEQGELYYTDFRGACDAGEYEITLRLYDEENYIFSSGATSLTLPFYITVANNRFTEISVKEEYFIGSPFDAVFRSAFGIAEFLFSTDTKEGFSTEFPLTPGVYYVMASVAPNRNYEGVSSAPIRFTLSEDELIALEISRLPDKLDYLAFERVSLDGMLLYASFLSGKRIEVANGDVSVYYKNEYGLSVTDRLVTLSYLDLALALEVSVSPCEYDISGVIFEDSSVSFSGKWQTLSAVGRVVGKDGKELTLRVTGGGVNCGRYTVGLEFSSQSLNYITPHSIYKTLDILPLDVKCEYTDTEFVYDGKTKAPTAIAYGVDSALLSIAVERKYCDAGVYIAVASIRDQNYRLLNPTCEFVINKAPLALSDVRLSEDSFIYDGSPKSVSLVGLPAGVIAVGYLDSVATEAGEYLAVASLSFDERNYYLDTSLSYKWSIRPAEYDMSGIEFLDSEFVYDGKLHTPSVIGALPEGADGSRPEYRFLGGVRDVSGEWVEITAVFSSGSKNYNAPPSIKRRVLITPLGIDVVWGELSYVYDGTERSSRASSRYCEISVIGSGIDAGVYKLTATSLDKNYFVINSEAELKIAKCQNEFTAQPSILSAYHGDGLIKSGSVRYGSAVFSFYLDSALTQPISEPTEVGSYYMTVSAEEGTNYLSITSPPIAFQIIEIVPVSLRAELLKDIFLSLDKIGGEDIKAYLVNNNGSLSVLDFSSLALSYREGDCLHFGDTSVGISACGLNTALEIRVVRRSYDMSAVSWQDTRHTYDGTEKTARLFGLPEGVTVKEYILNRATDAGEYTLSCRLEYDSENYNEPTLPNASLIIYKRELELPKGAVFTYDKEIKSLKIQDTEYYKGGEVCGENSGKYRLELALYDSKNYCFRGGESAVYLEILPREITLRVNQDFKSFTLTEGEIMQGDDIGAVYEQNGDFVYIDLQNPNYKAIVIPRNINDKSKDLWIILLSCALLLFVFFVCYYAYSRRQALPAVSRKPKAKQEPRSSKGGLNLTESLMCVDKAYADSLISNGLAKTLRKREITDTPRTGNRRARVSVGEISLAFFSGECVDIASLKQRLGLDSSVGRIRVIADGVIDKPLKIYADSFEPSALKMIALTGGECFLVRRRKQNILRQIFKNT